VLGMGIALALGAWIALVSAGRCMAAEQTTVHVLVKDAVTGDPIYQAHLTLQFRKPGGFLRRSSVISYTSKTDKMGRGMFPFVPMGEITLMVTAPDHESFGKIFKVSKANQLIEVQLRKPKPQL
jgi:hypothetical protein